MLMRIRVEGASQAGQSSRINILEESSDFASSAELVESLPRVREAHGMLQQEQIPRPYSRARENARSLTGLRNDKQTLYVVPNSNRRILLG